MRACGFETDRMIEGSSANPSRFLRNLCRTQIGRKRLPEFSRTIRLIAIDNFPVLSDP